MHIHLYYQYYHNPDCAATGRHYQLVKHLARKHSVTVITSDAMVPSRLTQGYPWTPDGVELVTINAPYRNAMGKARRLQAFARYARKAYQIGRALPRPDVIIGTSTPLSAAWIAGRIAKLKDVPWVFEVRDLWPDFPIQMGAIPGSWLKQQLRNVEHSLYQQASHVIPLSPDMCTHILEKGIPDDRVTTLVNGTDYDFVYAYDEEAIQQRIQHHNLAGKKVVLYAGTFGRANGIEALIREAELLKEDPEIQLVCLGAGYFKNQLMRAAERLPNLLVLPPAPRHAIFNWFRVAHLSLVPFIDLPVLNANSPAKFFDSLAVGTPVLVTSQGWTKSFIETHNCGWYASISEPGQLALGIRKAVQSLSELDKRGAAGAEIAKKEFDRAVLFDRFEHILMQCAYSTSVVS